MSRKKIWEKIPKEKLFRIQVVGHRLLVKPLDAEQESAINLLKQTKESDQMAQVYGTVIALGDLCFKDLSGSKRTVDMFNNDGDMIGNKTVNVGQAWCLVGDTILFHPYSYSRVRDPVTQEFRDDVIIVNDQDVYGVVHNLPEYRKAIAEEIAEAQEEEKVRVKTLKSKW